MNLLDRARRAREEKEIGHVLWVETEKKNKLNHAARAISKAFDVSISRAQLTSLFHKEDDVFPYAYMCIIDGICIATIYDKRGYDNLGARYLDYFYLVVPRKPDGYDKRPYRFVELTPYDMLIDLLYKYELYGTYIPE